MHPFLETPRELANRIGWPVRRIRAMIHKKQLRHVRVGGSIYLPANAFDEYLVSHMVEPEQFVTSAQEAGTIRSDFCRR